MSAQAASPGIAGAPRAPVARGAERVPLLAVGVIIFLGSELMFFGSLFGMYFTLRAQAIGPWPPLGVDLPVARATLFTIVLVASSFPMQMADHSLKNGNGRAMVRWMTLAFLMGATFVAGQIWDYVELGRSQLLISSNAYGSAFYTMTGFHLLHVIAGLVVMLVVLGRAAAGAYRKGDPGSVRGATYYWHFVDVVWIALYATLFLLK